MSKGQETEVFVSEILWYLPLLSEWVFPKMQPKYLVQTVTPSVESKNVFNISSLVDLTSKNV